MIINVKKKKIIKMYDSSELYFHYDNVTTNLSINTGNRKYRIIEVK